MSETPRSDKGKKKAFPLSHFQHLPQHHQQQQSAARGVGETSVSARRAGAPSEQQDVANVNASTPLPAKKVAALKRESLPANRAKDCSLKAEPPGRAAFNAFGTSVTTPSRPARAPATATAPLLRFEPPEAGPSSSKKHARDDVVADASEEKVEPVKKARALKCRFISRCKAPALC